jgi:hypothetical protein
VHLQRCDRCPLHRQVPQLEAHEVPAEHVAAAAAEAEAAGGGDDLREERAASLQDSFKTGHVTAD